jgi:hypothetical protein
MKDNTVYTPPTPEEAAKRNWISKAYYWFWHDVCHRSEPFTYTMRRSAEANPLPWFLIPSILTIGYAFLLAWLWGGTGSQDAKHYGGAQRWAKDHRVLLTVLPAFIIVAFYALILHLCGLF